MQGSYNRSGCWRQILIAKTCLAIFSTQKKPRFEPGTYFTILVVCLFLLLIFVSHTQTVCNCLAPCVSIMFTSCPRSFLPIPTCPPSLCCTGSNSCHVGIYVIKLNYSSFCIQHLRAQNKVTACSAYPMHPCTSARRGYATKNKR